MPLYLMRNLKENPLRILDSKSQEVREILKDAPVITEHLDKDSEIHFNKLKNILNLTGLSFKVNERLVRGLDYYNRSVFEWKTKELGSQDTICGGGRYDTLVEELGGSPCPAIGLSIGMERLVLLMKKLTNRLAKPNPNLDCFLICLEETAFSQAILYAEKIRENIPKINLKVNLESTSASSQFKRADKSGATIALILGEEELKNNTISFKNLREASSQESLSLDSVIDKLVKFL